MRILIAAFVLIAALIFSAFSPAAQNYASYSYLNEMASFIAQREVTVRCLTVREGQLDYNIGHYGAEAYVDGIYDEKGRWHPLDYTVFKYGLCEQLLKPTKVSEYAWAIVVLAHESAHLKGRTWSDNEAKTQCWAMKHFKGIANRLGNKDPKINNLLYAFALMWQKQMPKIYQSKCLLAPASNFTMSLS